MALEFDKADALRAKLFEGLAVELPGRARPKRTPQDPAARRELIRRTAAEMFAARGLDGASLADIGTALGKAPTFCSHYYRNRDELMYDILHDHVAALDTALDAADPLPAFGEPDLQLAVLPLARLDALARTLLDVLAERAPAQRVLISALHTLPQAARRRCVICCAGFWHGWNGCCCSRCRASPAGARSCSRWPPASSPWRRTTCCGSATTAGSPAPSTPG